MFPFLMRYFLLSSLFFTMFSCAKPYKNLQKTSGNVACVEKFRPIFRNALYKTHVDIIGKQLSGLLLLKTMPDSSIRVVFSSEVGFKFFDFGFLPDGNFKVFYILEQMNKKVVLNTLKKDFELVLMKNLKAKDVLFFRDAQLGYTVFRQKNEFDYYITDADCKRLIRIEKASTQKIKVQVLMQNYQNGIPDSIGIAHKTFTFNIGLKLVER